MIGCWRAQRRRASARSREWHASGGVPVQSSSSQPLARARPGTQIRMPGPPIPALHRREPTGRPFAGARRSRLGMTTQKRVGEVAAGRRRSRSPVGERVGAARALATPPMSSGRRARPAFRGGAPPGDAAPRARPPSWNARLRRHRVQDRGAAGRPHAVARAHEPFPTCGEAASIAGAPRPTSAGAARRSRRRGGRRAERPADREPGARRPVSTRVSSHAPRRRGPRARARVQGRHPRRRRARPRGPPGGDLRLPRPQRRRQDDHRPHPHHAPAPDGRLGARRRVRPGPRRPTRSGARSASRSRRRRSTR